MQCVLTGDSAVVLGHFPDDHFDCVVTDPPHALGAKDAEGYAGGFMQAQWDRELPSVDLWREVFRVLKPGGHCWVMSSERIDCVVGFYLALKEAGFAIDNHQMISWLTLTGMPKSSDVSKTADKEAFRSWLEKVGRETVRCPAHKLVEDPETGDKRCAACERVFAEGSITQPDLRKAQSAAVNGECPPARFGQGEVLSGDRTPAGAGMYDTAHSKQRHSAGAALLATLLSLHWPSDPASQRAQWEAVLGEVPAGWDCGRPPGVRVKTGETKKLALMRSGQGLRMASRGEQLPTVDAVITAPSTPDAVALDGWRGSTAPFKPLAYPIIHAQKPWQGSYLDCARATGGGPLNMRAGAVPFNEEGLPRSAVYGGSNATCKPGYGFAGGNDSVHDYRSEQKPEGRVPGNLLSHADLLHQLQRYADLDAWCERLGLPKAAADLLEAGAVYCPKPGRAEKEAGLEGFEEAAGTVTMAQVKQCRNCGGKRVTPGKGFDCGCDAPDPALVAQEETPRANSHSTVKPAALCGYFITLSTRPGETVLDPFCGSGSTGVAAKRMGRGFVGIELSEDFAAIARARIAAAEEAPEETIEEAQPQLALAST